MREEPIDFGSKCNVAGEFFESLQEILRDFLETENVEIKIFYKLVRALKLRVAIEYVPRIDLHGFIECGQRPALP